MNIFGLFASDDKEPELRLPIWEPYKGNLRAPVDPDTLVENLGIEEHIYLGKSGFARSDGYEYWRTVQPLIRVAAAEYQELPAAKISHHTYVAGMLIHVIDVAEKLVSQMRHKVADLEGSKNTLFHSEDRVSVLALIFAVGLFHEICSLHSSMRVYVFENDKTRHYFDPLDDTQHRTLFQFMSDFESTKCSYGWEFLPHRRLNPCLPCCLEHAMSRLRSTNQYPSQALWDAVSNTGSIEYRLLSQELKEANRLSMFENQADLDRRDSWCMHKRIEDALRYCATYTDVLDGLPIWRGSLFLSDSTVNRIPHCLPNYDEFYGVSDDLKYANDPMVLLVEWSFRCEMETYCVHGGEQGNFLKKTSKLNKDLICLIQSRR